MRLITDVIGDIERGQFVCDATDRLDELIAAVREHGKGGTITIELTVAANADNSVFVSANLKLKKPERSRGKSVFFVAEDGSLIRNDPRQHDLPLRDVSGPKIKDAANG